MKPSIESRRTFDRPPFHFYFFQLLGATLFICIVLYMMDRLSTSHLIWAVGASSLASSAYIVFMHPHGISAKPKNIAIAYVMAIIIGEIIRYIMIYLGHSCHIPTDDIRSVGHHLWLAAAISVTLMMIGMALTDTEHPPAAGIALVLVIELCRHDIVNVIFMLMLLLCAIQVVCRRYMRNLLR